MGQLGTTAKGPGDRMSSRGSLAAKGDRSADQGIPEGSAAPAWDTGRGLSRQLVCDRPAPLPFLLPRVSFLRAGCTSSPTGAARQVLATTTKPVYQIRSQASRHRSWHRASYPNPFVHSRADGSAIPSVVWNSPCRLAATCPLPPTVIYWRSRAPGHCIAPRALDRRACPLADSVLSPLRPPVARRGGLRVSIGPGRTDQPSGRDPWSRRVTHILTGGRNE